MHTHVNCWFRWTSNEGSESKNGGNSLAQPWPTCCFVRPGGYCRVLVLDTKALREHLWSPGGHLKRANCVAILIMRGILQLIILIALAQGNISQLIPELYHQLARCTQQINPIFQVECGEIGLPLSVCLPQVALEVAFRWLPQRWMKEIHILRGQ